MVLSRVRVEVVSLMVNTLSVRTARDATRGFFRQFFR